MITHVIPQNVQPMPLLRYVSRAYPMLNVRAVLKKRDIKVNGVRQNGDFTVRGGDELAIYADCDLSIQVIKRENGLIGVIKPQGLPVDADGSGIAGDTALTRVRAIYPRAELCHRLDAQTGGVLVFADEKKALEGALKAFKEHKVGKGYTAYVGGGFTAKQGEYHDFLIKDKVKSSVSIVRSGRNALPVHTRWRIIEAVDEKLTKMELEPVTGRTHQLRAHMAHYGHPILGDDKYGDRELNKAYRTKLCLWCRMVKVCGVEFIAEAPDWLER